MRVVEYRHIKPMYAFCRGCGAILEFPAREAKMSYSRVAHGFQGDGNDYYINCPVCGRAIFDGEWKSSVAEC